MVLAFMAILMLKYAVFVDGPIVLQPVDLDGAQSNADVDTPEGASMSSDPALIPRAWWKSNPERTAAYGLEQSLLMLRDILQKDRYDVSAVITTHGMNWSTVIRVSSVSGMSPFKIYFGYTRSA